MWTTPILTSVCWKSLNRSAVIQKQIRSAIEDGVVEPHEKTAINDELYLSISKLREHAALVYKIFALQKEWRPRVCSSGRRGVVDCLWEKLTHEQFNNTLPSLATDCAFLYRVEKRRWSIAMRVNVPGDREIVTHSFAEWAVGDFNRQKRQSPLRQANRWFKDHYGAPVRVILPGSRKHNGLSTSVKAMNMNASVRSNSFVVNSGKWGRSWSLLINPAIVWDGDLACVRHENYCSSSLLALEWNWFQALMTKAGFYNTTETIGRKDWRWDRVPSLKRHFASLKLGLGFCVARRRGKSNASNVYPT